MSFGAITTLMTCSENGKFFDLQQPVEGSNCWLSDQVRKALGTLSGNLSSYYTLHRIPSEHQGMQFTDGLIHE